VSFVHSIVRKRHPRAWDDYYDELVAAGLLGLVQAANRFDPGQQRCSFTTFAYPRILGAIADHLRQGDYLTRSHRAPYAKATPPTRATRARRSRRSRTCRPTSPTMTYVSSCARPCRTCRPATG
jgi:RNA polymerase sigma factor (sigma-70 family)